jgi:hypothetical protein
VVPLTDLQASMAVVQWRRLPEFLAKRRALEFYLKRWNPVVASKLFRHAQSRYLSFSLSIAGG